MELIALGTIDKLTARAQQYRAEEWGDTGMLALHNDKAIILEVSFESGTVMIVEYELPKGDESP